MGDHSVETIDLELAILIRRVTSANRKIGHLDRSAYLLLHRIIAKGPAGAKVLADEFQLDISTVSRQTAALEQKGYVYRIPDPLDGRAYTLQITELGKKEFFEHQEARIERISEVLEEWSDEERELFGQLLRKYNRSSRK
ncbi:MarR family transcriptional regulator [Neobacillus cucumis]|uniref:MarR family winged helix-turn-helix transcriptional regulator n=1 Tax=Neobacillus cucumis TaxID=1740721 RepID=UPI0018DFC664|nr:MarR family transcriptional regulator [Neobacillus cucumis]MBI0576938.1 MarR family transcriptional regulator [Neobacillus cucumis]